MRRLPRPTLFPYTTLFRSNFAHGELVTIGAVVAWTLNVTGGLQLIWATLLAIVVGAALGAANDLCIWRPMRRRRAGLDRKSTRLNSSHPSISYAVFCLKKK